MQYQMNFYCTKEPDGTIHVQNAVMGFLGQHHVYTTEDFEHWKVGITKSQIVWLDGAPCDCGLKPREVRSSR